MVILQGSPPNQTAKEDDMTGVARNATAICVNVNLCSSRSTAAMVDTTVFFVRMDVVVRQCGGCCGNISNGYVVVWVAKHATRAGIDQHNESGWSEEEAAARTTAVMMSSELWAASPPTST